MNTNRKTPWVLKRTGAALLALCMAGGALAQNGPGRDFRGDHGHGPRQAQQFERGRDHDQRRAGPRPHVDWHRGGRLPETYRGRNYVVNDWRGQHLRQPPRGYQWVGVNGDFVLAAIAGGVIAQIIAGH